MIFWADQGGTGDIKGRSTRIGRSKFQNVLIFLPLRGLEPQPKDSTCWWPTTMANLPPVIYIEHQIYIV